MSSQFFTKRGLYGEYYIAKISCWSVSILPCKQPIGRKTYNSDLLHLQKLTVLKFIFTTYLFGHKLCANTFCIRAPLDTWKRWTFRSFAGSAAEVWVDLGRRLSRTREGLRRSAPPSQQRWQQAAADHGTALSVAYFSTHFLWRHPHNNPKTICEIQVIFNLWIANSTELAEFIMRFISYGSSLFEYFFARFRLPGLLVNCYGYDESYAAVYMLSLLRYVIVR